MDVKKEIRFLRENFIFYLAGALLILGLKCYYRQADCDSLLWILTPTARWVQFLGKIPFTYISGTGYVNHSLRMVIAPSCSGVRFMTITFAMLVFSFVHVAASQKSGILHAKARGWGWIAGSALFSWLFTIFVNGLRIIIALCLPLYLEDAGLMGGVLTQDRLHTMIGVAVYFTALLVIYRLTGRFVHNVIKPAQALREIGKCAAPVFWYFALTLGLPFVSGIYRDSMKGFTEFAVLVIGCCAMILLPYMLVVFFRRHK